MTIQSLPNCYDIRRKQDSKLEVYEIVYSIDGTDNTIGFVLKSSKDGLFYCGTEYTENENQGSLLFNIHSEFELEKAAKHIIEKDQEFRARRS